MWFTILKTEQVGEAQHNLFLPDRLNIEGKCMKKLKRASNYLKGARNEIKAALQKVIDDINENEILTWERKWNPWPNEQERRMDTDLTITVESGEKGWGGDTFIIKTNSLGEWPYKVYIDFKYTEWPEMYACQLLENFNTEKSKDLNGYSFYKWSYNNLGKENDTDIALYTKRYDGSALGYGEHATKAHIIDRADRDKEYRVYLSGGRGYPNSTETYDQSYQHNERYNEALKPFHEKIWQILED